jgi:fermentation-respiration switch protein FrsA (DUF1100 family)
MPPPVASLSYTPSAPLPGGVAISFVLPRGSAPPPFFDVPWPTELLRKPDGRPDFRSFPGRDALLFSAYVAAADEDVDGYSVAPAIYFHFTGPLAAPRFPNAADPASAASPVFLVDVDPRSPERGTFQPLEHRFYPSALRFVPANTLAVKPVQGLVLRPGTLYAAVVRRDLAADELGTVMDLEILKWTGPRADAREEAARRMHAGVFDYLGSLGAPRERVAGIALFRTQVPYAVTARLLDAVARLPPTRSPRVVTAAWADHLARSGGRASYFAVEGVYCTPNFQSDIERAPFLADDGGRIVLDDGGLPRLVEVPPSGPYGSGECQGLLRARFVLTIPTGPMPVAGFPLLVSAHGTGGDAETFLGENDFAGWAASQGIAVVSTDQPLHGGRGFAPRPGSREPISISVAEIQIPLYSGAHAAEAAFYNPLHPGAARDNLRQAAVDGMVLVRVFTSTDFGAARGDGGTLLLPPVPGRAAPRFDRDRVIAAGHSQGSQSVAALGAVDPLVRGVILSGCGGDARLGVLRRKDLPLVPIFATLLGLEPGELDELHPLMTLVQTLADPIDPASYARLYWEPLPGRRLQSVLHYEGMTDTYAPPVTAEVLAVALRLTPLSPVVKRLAGLDAREGVLGDLLARPGPARLFAQFRSTQAENGHFVLYREPGAAELAMDFMKALTR